MFIGNVASSTPVRQDLGNLQEQLTSSNESLHRRRANLSQIDTAFQMENVIAAQAHAERLDREAQRLTG